MPITFDVNKDNLGVTQVTSSEKYQEAETDNSVWVKTGKFAFSANNITYAAFGQAMSYWDLFPREDEWGNIPVWGNATVIKSNRPDILVGQRLYGIFPMAEEVRLNLSDFMPGFLVDNSSHRSAVSPVYNRYTLVDPEQAQMPEEIENALVVFRPLFVTAYLLAVHLAENHCFEAKQIVLTSASSKTAICLSHYLKVQDLNVEVIALTSDKNKSFVSGLTTYDRVATYEEIASLDQSCPAALVDFAGDPSLADKMRMHMGKELRKVVGIGAADWQNSERHRNFPEDDADFFFAPTHITRRIQAWGPAEFQKRTMEAWVSLMPNISSWININSLSGAENIQKVYLDILGNKVEADEGYVLSF